MALDAGAAPSSERRREPAGPLGASLRWGLGWTIVVATLGATAGCVSATPVEAPAPTNDSSTNSTSSYDDRYSDCVDSLGDMRGVVDRQPAGAVRVDVGERPVRQRRPFRRTQPRHAAKLAARSGCQAGVPSSSSQVRSSITPVTSRPQ